MISSLSPESPKALRRRIRAARRAVPPNDAQAAADAVAARILGLPVFQTAQCLSAYLAFDGELDPAALLKLAWQQGKQVFLPVLRPDAAMCFAPYTPGMAMEANYYGIPEPKVPTSQWLEARALDLVFTPLVAFDEAGYRLGMGGGFYDRTFEFRRSEAGGPCLLGVAFELQRHPVPHRDWDIPLDGVVTEQKIYTFGERLG